MDIFPNHLKILLYLQAATMLNNTGKRLAFAFLVLTFIFWLISMVSPGWLVHSYEHRGSVRVSLSNILLSTLFVLSLPVRYEFLFYFPLSLSLSLSLSLAFFLSREQHQTTLLSAFLIKSQYIKPFTSNKIMSLKGFQ